MLLVMRSGVDPLSVAPPVQVQNEIDDLVPAYGDARRGQLEELAHRSDRYRDFSVLDFFRESVRLDGQRVPHGRVDAIRAAVSGGSLAYIFTSSLNARLQRSYQEAEDSTVGWVSVDNSIPNFKTNERPRMAAGANLEKLPRGGTAKHDKPSDISEEYRVARYAKKLTVDEQDVIDDNLGAITTQPVRMGAAARRLRPDLVYSILLANAALADTGALFNNTAVTTTGGHANLTTAALAAASLKAGIVAMAKQKDGKAQLNIAPRFLIVTQDLVFTARELVHSALIVLAGDADVERGNKNVLSDLDLQIRADNRIGAAGVTDPVDGTARTGLATWWFLTGNPIQYPTIEVGYLRASGAAPSVRSYVLSEGQWGIGWDVKLDIGAKALDWRALHKSTGAA